MIRRFGDWLRASLEPPPRYDQGIAAITNGAPAPRIRGVLWCLFALFAILILWATFGKLDIVATAEGKLVPRSFLKIVQPADAGIMRELLVTEGQRVAAGQVLIRMDTSISQADTKGLATEIAIRRLQMRRIDAEVADKPFRRELTDQADLFSKVTDQYNAYRQAYLDSLSQERAGLIKAQQDYESALQVRDKLKNSLQFYNRQADTFQKLGEGGFVSPLFVGDKERERGEKEQDYKAQEYALSALQAAISQSERKIAQITSQYRQQLQTERIQAMSQLERLEREWDKQEHKNSLLELRATHSSIVKDIATHTLGTVVTPGTILLTLVPLDEPLIAEVQVKNQDAGFIHADQHAKVKVVSYPFQKYGMVDGEVAHFGADASETAGGRPEEVNPEGRLAVTANYKTHIRLRAQDLHWNGETLQLLPGMQVVAEIKLGDRTVLEYLLSPVQKAVHEAGRER